MRDDLIRRMREHAELHQTLADHSDEQRQWCEDLLTAADELEAVQGWQPIETAPKDGVVILLTDGFDIVSVKWIPVIPEREERTIGYYKWTAKIPAGWNVVKGPRLVGMSNPTHWMPRIPLPPPENADG